MKNKDDVVKGELSGVLNIKSSAARIDSQWLFCTRGQTLNEVSKWVWNIT